MPRLPNFFIVGAPKAGTTSLYHYLDRHPGIYMSAIKEPHYFAPEVYPANIDVQLSRRLALDQPALRKFLDGPMREKRFGGTVTDWNDYLRLFANASNESGLGEASVWYLWSRSAARRIAAAIPEARILMLLRDPAERAFSQYLMGVSNGTYRCSFREHIRRNLAHRSATVSLHYPFLELGLYAEQLARYRECFGSNVWVGLYDDLKQRPRELCESACRFLALDPEPLPGPGSRHLQTQVPRLRVLGLLRRWGMWEAAAKLTPARLRPVIRRALTRRPASTPMDSADRAYLRDYYRDDTRRLESMLDRDLSAWYAARS